jgi:hypothetical protein
MTDSTTTNKPAPRRTSPLKLLIATVLVVGFLVVAWVTLLNWRKDGQVNIRPFDSSWWSPGVASAQPVLAGAKRVSEQASDALWAEGGLVDQAERWWSSKSARTVAPTTATSPSQQEPSAKPASPAKRYERAIADAEIDFQLGLDHYRRGSPKDGVITPERLDQLREARTRFLSAKDRVQRVIGPYSECEDHDPDRLADAKALAQYDERLLVSLNRFFDTP